MNTITLTPNLRGAPWMLALAVGFTAMTTLIKYLGPPLPLLVMPAVLGLVSSIPPPRFISWREHQVFRRAALVDQPPE